MTETPATPGHDEEHEAALSELRRHVDYLEQTLAAISGGGVDAVVMGLPGEERVYTLSSADRPYRTIVESMGEGAVTVSDAGVVLYANAQLATFLGVPRDSMIGRDLASYVDTSQHEVLDGLLSGQGRDEATRRGELELIDAAGAHVSFVVAVTDLDIDDVRMQCLVLTDLTAQREVERQRSRQAAEEARQSLVREMNDTIVQGLVTAEMALDLGQHDYAREVIASTSERARNWIGELAEGRQLQPGMARRRAPAGTGEEPG